MTTESDDDDIPTLNKPTVSASALIQEEDKFEDAVEDWNHPGITSPDKNHQRVTSPCVSESSSASNVSYSSPSDSPDIAACINDSLADSAVIEDKENIHGNTPLSSRRDHSKSPLKSSHKDSPMKNKRKSVSKSPWLSRTPKSSQNQAIIEEGIFISPDFNRPMVSPYVKGLRTSSKSPENNMNTTIFSQFMSPDLPQVTSLKRSRGSLSSPGSRSRVHGHLGSPSGCNSPDMKKSKALLYQTFVGDSPAADSPMSKGRSNLYKTFVGDSGSDADSASESDTDDMIIADSVPCTPDESSQGRTPAESGQGQKDYIGETDEENTPRIERINRLNESSMSVDSPIHTARTNKPRRAVIQSSDEEGEEPSKDSIVIDSSGDESDPDKTDSYVISSGDESEQILQKSITKVSSNSACSKTQDVGKSTRKNVKTKPTVVESSDEEDIPLHRSRNSHQFVSGESRQEGGSSDEEEEEDDNTDLSGFINNSNGDDDEEESTDEEDVSLTQVGTSKGNTCVFCRS